MENVKNGSLSDLHPWCETWKLVNLPTLITPLCIKATIIWNIDSWEEKFGYFMSIVYWGMNKMADIFLDNLL